MTIRHLKLNTNPTQQSEKEKILASIQKDLQDLVVQIDKQLKAPPECSKLDLPDEEVQVKSRLRNTFLGHFIK